MSPLPEARLTGFVVPFTYTGMDYFGPMIVTIGRRHEKRWGCLYTCMATRAIHLELAHSLSTESCVMCLRNFINRRGKPKEIHCDNGTNFVGMQREIAEAFANMIKTFPGEVAKESISFKFIPPLSPHHGGSWERMIRSVKQSLTVILKDRQPKEEVLRSALIEVENVINSRPLTFVPLEYDTAEALTPNHFLLGGMSHGQKDSREFFDFPNNANKQWRHAKEIANHFWSRWISEYLPMITRRSKWHKNTSPIKVGDQVIIVDQEAPRSTWERGVVVKVHESAKDHLIRSVDVKTAKAIRKRPVVKLAVLDIEKKEKI